MKGLAQVLTVRFQIDEHTARRLANFAVDRITYNFLLSKTDVVRMVYGNWGTWFGNAMEGQGLQRKDDFLVASALIERFIILMAAKKAERDALPLAG